MNAMNNFQFSLGSNPNAIIKVIGIGGAGGNAVNHMFQKGIKDVDFLVCNTDYQALERNLVRNRLQLGPFLTEGRGAGNQPEIGRKAAVETMEDFKELIGSDTKMVFITAGLGGGTGTGAAPVLAEACRALDILTVGIVTLPFSFEGKKRLEQAEDGLRELRQFCDTTLVISNDKVNDYVQTEAGAGTDVIWGNCTDETLGDALRVTLIATGFEGQNTRNYGVASGSTVKGIGLTDEKPVAVTVHQLNAVEAMAEEPKPSELDPKEALEATRKMLEKEWTFSEPVLENPAGFSEQARNEESENLPLFTVIDEGPTTDLQNTADVEPSELNLFTTVWSLDEQPSTKPEDQGPVSNDTIAQELGTVDAEINPFFGYDGTVEWDLAVEEHSLASTPIETKAEVTEPSSTPTFSAPKNPAPLMEERVQDVYPTGPNEDDVLTRSRQRIQNLRKLNSLINAPGMPSLEELEKVPAYVRAGYQPDLAPGSAEMPLSRTSIGSGQGNSGIIQTGNRYLHDNVD